MFDVIEGEDLPSDVVSEPPPEAAHLSHGRQRRAAALLSGGDDGVDGQGVVQVQEKAAAGVRCGDQGGHICALELPSG